MKDFVVKAGTYKNINCKFHGFVNDKKQIYQSIDILLHFNKVEPLGRIVMEALDFGIPFRFQYWRYWGVGTAVWNYRLHDSL